MNSSIAAQNMAWKQQMLVAYGLALLFTVSHAQNIQKNNSTVINEEKPNDPPRKANPPAVTTPGQRTNPGSRPVTSAGPKQNITLNDLLTALLSIQKNQLTTTENPAVINNGMPVTDAPALPANPTTPNQETNINDIINGGGNANQSVIILNIGDLLGTQLGGVQEQQILSGLNGINCQQGYIYVLLPGGRGKFVPLNQANTLPQNGVPSYIILLANGQPNFQQNSNWQQVNGMLPNLGINIPGLSKIGSIPIYAPTNQPSPGVVNTNVQQPTLYPGNNPNFSINQVNTVPEGLGQPNSLVNNPNINFVEVPTHQPTNPIVNYPNFNVVQQPSHQTSIPNTVPNVNTGIGQPNPVVNNPNINFVKAPISQPTNPIVNYPNFNVVQQPSHQTSIPNTVPNVNIPTITIGVPNQPNQPTSTGVVMPNWPSPVNPPMNIILPTQPPATQPINIPIQSMQPTIPVNSGINIPVSSGISIPGNNLNIPTQHISQPIPHGYPNGININGTNLINLLRILVTQSNNPLHSNIHSSDILNLPITVPSQVGSTVGIQYPVGNIPESTVSNVNIDLMKLIELLGLQIGNVPTKINPQGSMPQVGRQPSTHDSELLSSLLKHLGGSSFDEKYLNNDNVRIIIEKGQDERKPSVPHLTDMLLHYIKKNMGTSSKSDTIHREDTITPEVLFKFLGKTPTVGSNPQIKHNVITPPVHNVPVIKFELQNTPKVGQQQYIPNVPVNIPSGGIITGQVAVDPQYLASLMKTFSGINLPQNYITSGVQPIMGQSIGAQPGGSMNSILWNYLLAHIGCIPDNQSIGGNYMQGDNKMYFGNQFPASNWAQVPQFSHTGGMPFRYKRAIKHKS